MSKEKKRKILIFNSAQKLLAICLSTATAARMTQSQPQGVYKTCIGKTISHNNYYFRYLYEDKVSIDEIAGLTVKKYDKSCGIERKYSKNK